MRSAHARARLTGDALKYLRARGVRAVARKCRQLYVYDRERIYLTHGDLDSAIERPLGQNGVEVRLARPDDAPLFAAFTHVSPHTVRTWLGPDHHVLLALKDGVPAGYRWLSTRVTPAIAPVLRLRPDQLFSMMAFVSRSFRRQGIHFGLKVATGHLLRPLGFREVWGTQSPFNHTIQDVTLRPTNITGYVGTLTRHCFLGLVRFSFTPTTFLSAERVAGPIDALTAVLGSVRRLEMLVNRVSVSATLDVLESIGRQLGIDLRVTAVRETDGRQAEEFGEVLDRVAADRPDGMLVLHDPMFVEHRRTIADMAAARGLPTVCEGAEFAEAGGLLACGVAAPPPSTLPDSLRRVVMAADPVRLVINLATARRLGLTVPGSLLERADRVIH